MDIQLLSFSGCPGIEPTLTRLKAVMRDEGVECPIQRVEVADDVTAHRERFLGSPSIRINGLDIETSRRTDSPCFGCRLYPAGEPVPPEAMIRDAIRQALSITDAVRTRFDRLAAEWDANPGRVAIAKAVTAAIRNAVTLRPDMVAMDFGAGTGLVTLGLLSDVGSLTAVDASGEMLRLLDEKLKALQLVNVRTLLCEVGKTMLPADGFDLIVSSMVLHHLPDVPLALHLLRPCLRPGGWIALADLYAEDGTFHADPAGVFHHGFDPTNISRWLQAAGFTDASAREAHRIVRTTTDGQAREYPVFLVTGRAD